MSPLAMTWVPLVAFIVGACAGPPVRHQTASQELQVLETQRRELRTEVTAALDGVTSIDFGEDMQKIEAILLPIFNVSPKNEHGRLKDSDARYALHRYFMQQHGWDIRSFDQPDEETANSCLFNFGRQVPFEMQAVLEKHIVKGASIVELSMFAALLEHLIQDELPGKLKAAYKSMQLPLDGAVDQKTAETLMDFYMASHIRSSSVAGLSVKECYETVENMTFLYNNWAETRQFFRRVQEELIGKKVDFVYADVFKVVDGLEDKLSYWNGRQCQAIKDKLLAMEYQSSGRVSLLEFYDSALHKGNVQFIESMDYLRQLGALDESDVYEPRVVISNYLDGPSNCIARTSYYSVCCIDECAQLYDQIEMKLGKPQGSFDEIMAIVQGLSTPTMPHIEMPEVFVRRLRAITKNHGGLIPVHSVDFAEWMHWAFPRECTNPDMFGTAHFMTMEEWEVKFNLHSTATVQDLKDYLSDLSKLAKQKEAASNETLVPPSWIEQEILLAQAEEATLEFQGSALGQILLGKWTASPPLLLLLAIIVVPSFYGARRSFGSRAECGEN